MPTFYAKSVAEDAKCFNSWINPILKPMVNYLGVCKNMADYKFKTDE